MTLKKGTLGCPHFSHSTFPHPRGDVCIIFGLILGSLGLILTELGALGVSNSRFGFLFQVSSVKVLILGTTIKDWQPQFSPPSSIGILMVFEDSKNGEGKNRGEIRAMRKQS